jgi:hypothetical protein
MTTMPTTPSPGDPDGPDEVNEDYDGTETTPAESDTPDSEGQV